MPFTPIESLQDDQLDLLFGTNVQPTQPRPQTDAPGPVQLLKDSFTRHNTVYNAYRTMMDSVSGNAPGLAEDTGYDPIAEAKRYGIPEDRLGSFAYVDNQKEFDYMVDKLRKEDEARERLDNGGLTSLMTDLAAGVLDPVNFLPVGSAILKWGTAGSAVKGAIAGAGAGIPSMLASELSLKAMQETRSTEEVATNVLAGAMLSGVLGAGVGALTKSQAQAAKTLSSYDEAAESARRQNLGESIGAARVDENAAVNEALRAASLEDLNLQQPEGAIAKGLFNANIASAAKFVSPSVRLALSDNVELRRTVHGLVNTGLQVEGHKADLSFSNVETSAERYHGMLVNAIAREDEAFKVYRAKGGTLKRDAFLTEVIGATRRGNKHASPEVVAASKAYTKEFLEPLEDAAVEVGILDADLVKARRAKGENYVTRLWDADKIAANQPEFEARLRSDLDLLIRKNVSEVRDDLGVMITKLKATSELDGKLKAKLRSYMKELDMEDEAVARQELANDLEFEQRLRTDEDAIADYVEESVAAIVQKLKKAVPTEPIPRLRTGLKGPLRARSLPLDTLRYEDFLVNDMAAIGSRLARTVGAQIELKRHFGTYEFQDLADRILKEHEQTIKDLPSGADRTKAKERIQRDVKDLRTMWELVSGTYHTTHHDPDSFIVKAAAGAKTFNYATYLGEVVVSSFSELMTPVLRHGIQRTLGAQVKTLVNSLKRADKDLKKVNKRALRQMDLAVDTVRATRALSIYGAEDQVFARNGYERLLGRVGGAATKLTFLDRFTEVTQGITATITHTRIHDALYSSKLSKADNEFLNYIGIDKKMRDRMKAMFDEHGYMEGDMPVFDTSAWQDRAAAEAYKHAITMDNRNSILIPGVGDKPLFTNTPIGGMLTQFMSWAMASNQRILLSGLQRSDGHFLEGVALMVGLGMMSYYTKALLNDREVSDDPRVWIAEGIDRSGVVSLLFFANRQTENFGLGIHQLTGEQLSRNAYRSAWGDILGPSFATGERLHRALYSSTKPLRGEELNEGDISNYRRLILFNNVVGPGQIFNRIEEQMKQNIRENK